MGGFGYSLVEFTETEMGRMEKGKNRIKKGLFLKRQEI